MLRKDKTKSDRRDVYVDHNIRLKTVGIGAKKKKKRGKYDAKKGGLIGGRRN